MDAIVSLLLAPFARSVAFLSYTVRGYILSIKITFAFFLNFDEEKSLKFLAELLKAQPPVGRE